MSKTVSSWSMRIDQHVIDSASALSFQKEFFQMSKTECFIISQGSHWLEKYLNIQDCLEKSLKIKFALKST